ncbi:MAG: hypothetical protein ACK4UO_01405 [Pseudolabrys sp.]
MPNEPPGFRRLVLGLQPSVPDRGLRLAIEFAELMRLELLGLFLEDSNLRVLAGTPFAREFRGPAAGWQPFDLESVSRDLDAMAATLRRMFEAAAGPLETEARFEVLRGVLPGSIAPVLRSGDILAIVEPASPAERMTSLYASRGAAALRAAAAVLWVPARIVRRRGPVVAIAATPDDSSVRAAAAIARAAREELVIIDADHGGATAESTAAESGLKVERLISPRGAFPDPAACAQAFRELRERLVVITRGAFDDSVASTIASVRQVPVLVIAPATPVEG